MYYGPYFGKQPVRWPVSTCTSPIHHLRSKIALQAGALAASTRSLSRTCGALVEGHSSCGGPDRKRGTSTFCSQVSKPYSVFFYLRPLSHSLFLPVGGGREHTQYGWVKILILSPPDFCKFSLGPRSSLGLPCA